MTRTERAGPNWTSDDFAMNEERARNLHVYSADDWYWLLQDARSKGVTPEAYAAKYGVTLSPSRAVEFSRRGGDMAEVLSVAEDVYRDMLAYAPSADDFDDYDSPELDDESDEGWANA